MTQTDPRPRRRRRALSILKRVAIALLVAGLLGWVLQRAWDEAGKIDWASLDMRPGLIALSVGVVLVAWALHGALWALMMRALGYPLALPVGIRANLVGNLGNYIPGKIFIVILRAKMVKCEGVPGMVVASSVVLETLLRNMVAALLAVIGLWHLGVGRDYVEALGALTVVCMVAVHPAIFNRLTDFALRKLNRPPLPRHLRLKPMIGLLCGYAVYWAIYVVAFWLLASGTLGADLSRLSALAVSLFTSLIASMLAIFAPVGLGVADATMASMLGLTAAVAAPAVLAVIARVWRTLTEVGAAGIGWVLPVGPRLDFAEATTHGDTEDAAAGDGGE